MAYPLGNSRIKPFSTTLDERRAKLAAHILRASDNDPMRQVTFQAARHLDLNKKNLHVGLFFVPLLSADVWCARYQATAPKVMISEAY